MSNLTDNLNNLANRLAENENVTRLIQEQISVKATVQAESMYGMIDAMCVDTIDPWKKNRVRFFNPLLHKPNTPVKSLPYAWPISPQGGFDASGCTWIPPAGSTLCIMFRNGHRDDPYYLGTMWHGDRGADGEHKWGITNEEYNKIHEGHRNGYLVGPKDGSQVYAPWPTENSNGFFIDSIQDFENDVDAQNKITYPNIHGWITPQKHGIKLVDGDYKCNHKGKRFELYTSAGNWMVFKDDHLHEYSSYAHPDCGVEGDQVDCVDEDGKPTETGECGGTTPKGTNKYFGYEHECRPHKGPGTPQNNKIELPQSGWQVLSKGGGTILIDDSVLEPKGVPNWESGTRPFDWGCQDICQGKIQIISMTGHKLTFSDKESDPKQRGNENYAKLESALGNSITLNDHTITGCEDQPIAGEERGILIQSTSKNIIQLCDNENDQSISCRRGGNTPIAKAKKAFIKARTGYGIEIMLDDLGSQEETSKQSLTLFCPHKDNKERGPHILKMQENPDGPGEVSLIVGGNYICVTHDGHTTVVGDKDKNPGNHITIVSKHTISMTEGFYFNKADVQVMVSKKAILLMAGEDCEKDAASIEACLKSGGDCSTMAPCVYPALCLGPNGVMTSDRVFISASKSASPVSIFQLTPFHENTAQS